MILKTLLINSGGSTATPPPRCQHTWRPPSALLLALCLGVVATGLQLYYGGTTTPNSSSTVSNCCCLVWHRVINKLRFRIWAITAVPGTNKYVHRYRPLAHFEYSVWILCTSVNASVYTCMPFFQSFPYIYQTVRLSQNNLKILCSVQGQIHTIIIYLINNLVFLALTGF